MGKFMNYPTDRPLENLNSSNAVGYSTWNPSQNFYSTYNVTNHPNLNPFQPSLQKEDFHNTLFNDPPTYMAPSQEMIAAPYCPQGLGDSGQSAFYTGLSNPGSAQTETATDSSTLDVIDQFPQDLQPASHSHLTKSTPLQATGNLDIDINDCFLETARQPAQSLREASPTQLPFQHYSILPETSALSGLSDQYGSDGIRRGCLPFTNPLPKSTQVSTSIMPGSYLSNMQLLTLSILPDSHTENPNFYPDPQRTVKTRFPIISDTGSLLGKDPLKSQLERVQADILIHCGGLTDDNFNLDDCIKELPLIKADLKLVIAG